MWLPASLKHPLGHIHLLVSSGGQGQEDSVSVIERCPYYECGVHKERFDCSQLLAYGVYHIHRRRDKAAPYLSNLKSR